MENVKKNPDNNQGFKLSRWELGKFEFFELKNIWLMNTVKTNCRISTFEILDNKQIAQILIIELKLWEIT